MSFANERIVPPDLKELFNRRFSELSSRINCCSIGTIVSFDSTEQTAEVRLVFKRVIKNYNPLPEDTAIDNQSTDITMDYPLLLRCPVVILNGGGGYLTFPITKGDTCLILFCDRDIDNWLVSSSGDPTAPNTSRMHSLSDGIALVGVFSKAKSISSYDTGGINIDCWFSKTTGIFEAGNGVSGSFRSADGKLITVNKGIIIQIT